MGIERVGDIYQVMFGRQLNRMGAHCKADRMNHRSIGICCVGNFEKATPPPEQWALTLRVVNVVIRGFTIPVEHVLGHDQVDIRKHCPGKNWDMHEFREQLRVIK
jgi:N-acetyl-anhydromuramyl-L-alanine amidase AmpD